MPRMRAALDSPPPGMLRQPYFAAPSNAVQNPRNGQNENAKYTQSPGVTPDSR